jgi:simple sugar transport system permease protein
MGMALVPYSHRTAIGGAIWGSHSGVFKAFLNINEVITSIMFNWIGLHLVNLLITSSPKMMLFYWTGEMQAERTVNLLIANPNAIIPTLGLDQLFNSDYISISIVIAILIAIAMHIVLNKTVFGYELKACGLNKHASKYAGINTKRNIILSMTIAGALAGIGGGMFYLTSINEYTIERIVNLMGFNGIPVALIASSHPLGTIFSALFIATIQIGGEAMQPEFSTEIINIITAVFCI